MTTCDARAALAALRAEPGHITKAEVDKILALPPHGHHYVSTACQHGLHDECREVCKFCSLPCACPHHDQGSPSIPTPDPPPGKDDGPPLRSGGLSRPTTHTMTPAEFLKEARSNRGIERVHSLGSLTLRDASDTWTAVDCKVTATGRYGISSFHATTAEPLDPAGTTWEHCEVDGNGVATTAIVGSHLRWVDGNVHSATSDLFKPFDYVTVLRGQAHGIRKADGAHADVIQIVRGRHILIEGLWADATLPDGEQGNAVLQMGRLSGDVIDVVVRGCWANGGHYTLRGLGAVEHVVEGFHVVDNWLGPDHTYGPTHALPAGNRWGFTGTTRPTKAKARDVVLGQLV